MDCLNARMSASFKIFAKYTLSISANIFGKEIVGKIFVFSFTGQLGNPFSSYIFD